MTLYQTHAVLLKPSQREILLRAVQERTGAVIRLPQYAITDPHLGSEPAGDSPPDDSFTEDSPPGDSSFTEDSPPGDSSFTGGSVELPLTNNQMKKYHKNEQKKRGVDLHMSKTQIRQLRKASMGGLMGINKEGEGVKDTAKKVAHHAGNIAVGVGKKLQPVVIDLLARQAEKKLRERYGTGLKKKLTRCPM